MYELVYGILGSYKKIFILMPILFVSTFCIGQELYTSKIITAPESGYIQKVCALEDDNILIFYVRGYVYHFDSIAWGKISINEKEWIDIECTGKQVVAISNDKFYRFASSKNKIRHSVFYSSGGVGFKKGVVKNNKIVVIRDDDVLINYSGKKISELKVPQNTESVLVPDAMIINERILLWFYGARFKSKIFVYDKSNPIWIESKISNIDDFYSIKLIDYIDVNDHFVAIADVRDKNKKSMINMFVTYNSGKNWKTKNQIRGADDVIGDMEKITPYNAVFPVATGGFFLVNVDMQSSAVTRLIPEYAKKSWSLEKSDIFTSIHVYDKNNYVATRAPSCNACNSLIELGQVK